MQSDHYLVYKELDKFALNWLRLQKSLKIGLHQVRDKVTA